MAIGSNAPHHKGLIVLVASAAGWQRFDVDPDPNLKLLGQVKTSSSSSFY
jgi:hypothetical protein